MSFSPVPLVLSPICSFLPAAGCTFDEDSEPGFCEYRQGQDDDFDWQLIRTYNWPHPTPDLLRGRIFILVPQLKLLMSQDASPWRYCSIKPDRADSEVSRRKSVRNHWFPCHQNEYVGSIHLNPTRLGPRFTGRMLPVNHWPWCMIHIWMWSVLTPAFMHERQHVVMNICSKIGGGEEKTKQQINNKKWILSEHWETKSSRFLRLEESHSPGLHLFTMWHLHGSMMAVLVAT